MGDKIHQMSWVKIALLFFVIAGCTGALLRLAFVIEMPEWLSYRNLTHAHSHVAMMGWVYMGMYIFVVKFFNIVDRRIAHVFWLSCALVMGMAISFPIQGYGFISILLTSLHMILSYVFVYLIFRGLKSSKEEQSGIAIAFLKAGLIFLVVSTIGTWMLGILMKNGMKGSALYYGSVQFFLHFQFNGWFVFTVLAIFFKYLKSKNILINEKLVKHFYKLLILSCFLTYALAITWSTPDTIIFWVNSIGVVIQTIAITYFIKILVGIKGGLKENLSLLTLRLWMIAALCFIVKVLIQSMVAIPYLATVSYTIKNFVIGFIHLLMLGTISMFLIGNFYQFYKVKTGIFKWGTGLFLTGFLGSELLLFFQGILLWVQWGFMPFYYESIFITSLFMPLGITLLFSSFFTKVGQGIQIYD